MGIAIFRKTVDGVGNVSTCRIIIENVIVDLTLQKLFVSMLKVKNTTILMILSFAITLNQERLRYIRKSASDQIRQSNEFN